MAHDITRWKTNTIDNLVIPLQAIMALPKPDTVVTFIVRAEGLSEGFELEGILEGDRVRVAEIRTSGRGSNATWEAFVAMLQKSTGTLRASLLWEGGRPTALEVINGEVIIRSVPPEILRQDI